MQHRLSKRQIIVVASTLFGLLFGAGNLIFPVHVGQLAGSNAFPAFLGFILTGVGIPILGILSISFSNKEGLFSFSAQVSKPFAYFFSMLLYLSLGPLFVFPRSASISYGSGLQNIVGDHMNQGVALFAFSFLFFLIVAFFTFRPSGITTWVGKIINPAFLVFFGTLIIIALINPMGDISEIAPDPDFETDHFYNGFLQGYGTMDVIAGLAFGIVVIKIIKSFGIKTSKTITKSLIAPGILTGISMTTIYGMCIFIGAQSRGVFETSSNGSIALSQISNYYFGIYGDIFLTTIVTLASLTTCIGLATSCSTAFTKMFPKGPSYNIWVFIFVLGGFIISNFGLDLILELAIPILAFLYPVAIVLIILSFAGRLFNYSSIVFKFCIGFTLVSSVLDFFANLPVWIEEPLNCSWLTSTPENIIPFMDIGLGWIIPSIIGFVIGIIVYKLKSSKQPITV